MSDEATDFLIGAAGAVAKFPEVGDKVVGKVLRYEKRQSKDMATGELKTWEDGTPVYEVVITLQTEDRDPEIEDDDGLRRLFVRGGMLNAVRDALRAARWRQSLVGGTLGVKYVGDGTPSRRGFSAPKQFKAMFEAPSPADDFEAMSEPEYDEGPF